MNLAEMEKQGIRITQKRNIWFVKRGEKVLAFFPYYSDAYFYVTSNFAK